MRRFLKLSALVVASLALIAGGLLAWQIGPRNILGILMYDQRREGDLVVGDRAPDVRLAKLDGSGDARLAEFIGDKPLVIVFGSFT